MPRGGGSLRMGGRPTTGGTGGILVAAGPQPQELGLLFRLVESFQVAARRLARALFPLHPRLCTGFRGVPTSGCTLTRRPHRMHALSVATSERLTMCKVNTGHSQGASPRICAWSLNQNHRGSQSTTLGQWYCRHHTLIRIRLLSNVTPGRLFSSAEKQTTGCVCVLCCSFSRTTSTYHGSGTFAGPAYR